jgi:hypothetical protein
MSTPLNFLQASVRADELVARQNIGIGTDSQSSELHIKASAPEIRLEDRVGAAASETATRIYANSGNTYIQSGVNFTDGSSSNIVFGSMGNTTEFVNIGAHGIETTGNLFVNNLQFTQTQGLDQILNVSNTTSNIMTLTNTSDYALNVAGGITLGSNLAVNTDDLFVDTQAGRVGIGSTQPTESLDIVGNLNLQKVSNTATIKLNSNVVTEYTRSKKLIKYPRVAMTANSSGGYVASSSTSNQPPYKAFDNILFSSYFEPVFNTNPYPNADGAYTGGTGTVYSTNGYQGDYLQIQLPETIKLYSYSISNRKGSSVAGRQPKDAKIFASNDGSTWVDIHTHFDGGETYDVTDGETRSFNLSNVPETYYKYYRLVVNSIIEGGSSDTPNISDWSLFGTPEYDPEAHGTDVIMRSVPNVPNTDWLEVYWDAGNTSSYSGSGTTVNDLSGNGVTGTITGTNGFDSTYKAFTFDGSGDYIQGTTSIGTGAVIHTWSLWVKNLTPTSTQYAYICGFGTAGSATMSGFMLRNGDRLEFTAYGTYVYYEDFPNTANTWKHVVGVYRGGAWNSANCDIYIDGRKVSVVGTSTTTLNISGTTVNIGSNPGGGQPFVGSIANSRLFNRALSADEVWHLYAYQKDYFNVSPDVVTFKSGRLGIGTSEPRAVLDVKGDTFSQKYNGGRSTFLAWDYTGTKSTSFAQPASDSGGTVESILDHEFDVPSCYHELGTATLQAYVNVDWRGEVPSPWNFLFRLKVYYNDYSSTYTLDSSVAPDSDNRGKGCGLPTVSFHNNNDSTLEAASVTSQFTLTNCQVSNGSKIKVELIGVYADVGGGAINLYTGRSMGGANVLAHEMAISSFFVALDVV